MSGPKLTEFYVSAAQGGRLELSRLNAYERFQVNRVAKHMNKLEALLQKHKPALLELEARVRATGAEEAEEICRELEDRFDTLWIDLINGFNERTVMLDAYVYSGEMQMDYLLSSMENDVKRRFGQIGVAKWENAHGSVSEQTVRMLNLVEERRRSLIESMEDLDFTSSSHDFASVLKVLAAMARTSGVQGSTEDLDEQFCGVCTELIALSRDDGVGSTFRARLIEEADRLEDVYGRYVNEATATTGAELRNALNNARETLDGARRRSVKMHELYNEYEDRMSLLEERGYARQRTELYAFSDSESLEDEVDELEEALARIDEDAYIAQALDTVMAEHGYATKRAVVLDAGEDGRPFYLSDRDRTGIFVNRSANGSYLMMTASADSELYRETSESLQISFDAIEDAAGVQRMVDKQETFCSLYAEIGDDLERLGVNMRCRRDAPASPESAVAARVVRSGRTAEIDDNERRLRDRRASAGPAHLERR